MVAKPVVVSFRSRTPKQPPPPSADPAARGRMLLEAHYHLIEKKLRHLSRRSGLPEHESDDLFSFAMTRLVADDYRILASWEGRSTFPTFLTVVLMNLMRDYRIHIWGKWRPTAAAKRLGGDAVLLEQLLRRDGLSLEEATERMRTENGVSLSRAEIEELATLLPLRMERRRVGEEELLRIPVDGQVESRIEDAERARTEAELRVLMAPLLQSLPAEDRLLLKFYFWDGLSMAVISRLLGRPQRELYSVRDKCLKMLRRNLEAAGLNPERIRTLLGRSHLQLAPVEL